MGIPRKDRVGRQVGHLSEGGRLRSRAEDELKRRDLDQDDALGEAQDQVAVAM